MHGVAIASYKLYCNDLGPICRSYSNSVIELVRGCVSGVTYVSNRLTTEKKTRQAPSWQACMPFDSYTLLGMAILALTQPY